MECVFFGVEYKGRRDMGPKHLPLKISQVPLRPCHKEFFFRHGEKDLQLCKLDACDMQ